MTLQSSFAWVFLTRFTWNPCTLWDSFLLQYFPQWCFNKGLKIRRGAMLIFQSLEKKWRRQRLNSKLLTGGAKMALQKPSGGNKARSEPLSLQEAQRTEPWNVCKVSVAGPKELFWWTQVGQKSLKTVLCRGYNLLLLWRPPPQCNWCYAHSDNIWAAYSHWSSFSVFFPTQSQPSFPWNYKQGPVSEVSSWWTQLLKLLKAPLSPGFACAQHCSLLLFGWEGHFSSLSARAEWRPAGPSFTVAVLLTSLPPFKAGFCTESELSLLYFYYTPPPRQAEPIHQNNTGELVFWC